jgi:hypothetical protein
MEYRCNSNSNKKKNIKNITNTNFQSSSGSWKKNSTSKDFFKNGLDKAYEREVISRTNSLSKSKSKSKTNILNNNINNINTINSINFNGNPNTNTNSIPNEFDYLKNDFNMKLNDSNNYNNYDNNNSNNNNNNNEYKYPEYLFKLISNEEKIFDDFDEEYNNNNNYNYKVENNGDDLFKRIQKKKKENRIIMNPIQKLLSKIYKNDYKSLAKIQDAKKKKNLNLEEYQNNLVKTISHSLGKNSLRKLEEEMKNLKFMSKCVSNFKSKKFIKQVEDKEYLIVCNMQKNEKQLEKLRKIGRINQIQPIPNIKFKRILKD